MGINENGEIILPATNDNKGYEGYCVYIVDDRSGDDRPEYEYYSYKVTTSMTLDFGLFDMNIPIRMSSKTSSMYSCYGDKLNC